VEAQCLEETFAIPPFINATCSVRTPKLYESNVNGHNQVMEYVTNGTNLKAYVLRFYAPPTSDASKSQCFELEQALGSWLRSFHDWASLPEQSTFRNIVSSNVDLQRIRYQANYASTVRLVNRFPSILENSVQLLEQVRDATAAELRDEAALRPIHGDFWTGKYVFPMLKPK